MLVYRKMISGQYIDVYGHMNHARFIELFEEARWHLCLELLNDLAKYNTAFIIVNLNIDYKRAANCQDWVLIDAQLHQINNSSIILKQTMRHETTQKILSSTNITLALVDLETKRAKKINGEIKQILEQWQEKHSALPPHCLKLTE